LSRQLGERKNVSKLTDKEREAFREAFVALNKDPTLRFPGSRDDKPFVGSVSFWFKQDEIHQATHVHGGPAFLTWHRELLNRFERLLIEADASVSLHYWDWNEDPENTIDHGGEPLDLFTNPGFLLAFMIRMQLRIIVGWMLSMRNIVIRLMFPSR
jgi:hypothetical protein